jgi:hypothetical protein
MKIFKFLEINRFDRGLFRIWIILSIFWVIFILYALHQDKIYIKFRQESSMAYICGKSLGKEEYFPSPFSNFLENKDIDDRDLIIRSHKYYKFDNLEDCKKWTKYYRSQFFIIIAYLFFVPLAVVFFWFLLKKTYLWLYRGFK